MQMEFEDAFYENSDFEISSEEPIGSGNFGNVYKVQRIDDNSVYAAKILKSNTEFDGNQQRLILRESMILHRLHHPAILKFLGVNFQSIFDRTLIQPTIITEYLPNGSLKYNLGSKRKNKAWTPTKKYITLIGISDAMRYLHECDVIHRDLKPQNILMDENYYPRVCDFGLSRIYDSMNSSMTGGVGTPRYMAPELFNSTSYDKSVDVYAFGMIAYEITTGNEPFFDYINLNAYQLGNRVQEGRRPHFVNDEVPLKMKELIERCWNQNPSYRPTFNEIYELLSSDFSYFSEKVDEEEVQNYINELRKDRIKKETNSKTIKKVEKEEEKDSSKEEEEEEDEDEEYERVAVYQDKNSIVYRLFDSTKNAEIIESPNAKGDVVVPSFVRFGSSKYKITNICDNSFSSSLIKSLSFSNKSLLNHIGNSVFENSTIQSIHLPKSVTKVEPLWIKGAYKLNEIKVDPENLHFKYNNQLLFYSCETKKEIAFASHEFKDDFSVPKKTTRIGDFSFMNVLGISSFESTIPTLKEIGSYSFCNCINLTTVNFKQENDLSLLSFCFSSCEHLSTVEISCKSIKMLENIFFKCESLKSIKITTTDSVQLHQKTFERCNNLETISFHESSEIEIKDDNFSWPNQLKCVSFIDVKKVTFGPSSFTNIKKLKEISVINSDELIIGNKSICCLPSLDKINLISKSFVFESSFACKCISLTQATIVCNSDKCDISIPTNSFRFCNSIEFFSFKSNSKLIFPTEFLSESKTLQKVVVSGKNVKFCDNCFSGCSSLKNVEIVNSGKVKFGKNEFKNCHLFYQIIILVKGKTSFDSSSFCECDGLIYFNQEGGVANINNGCFRNNKSLEILNFIELKEIVVCDEQFAELKSLKSATFDSESIITIGELCFANSKLLKSVKFSSDIIDINKKAFSKCVQLKEVLFNKKSEKEWDIEKHSNLTLFEKTFNKSGLEKIDLNGKIVILKDKCFYKCQSLKQLIFGQIINLTLGSNLFIMCTQLKSIQIENIKTLKIRKECFVNSSVNDAYFQASEVIIKNDAFKNNNSIATVRINGTNITLKNNVFENCLNLQKIEFNATTNLFLGDKCLYGCKDLTKFVLNGNLLNIGNSCFSNCVKLEKLNFQDKNQLILGDEVFVGCNNVTSIDVKTPTKFQAGKNCFSSLSRLNTVQISSKDISLDNSCFEKCSYLNDFTVLEAEKILFGEKAFFKCSKLNEFCIRSDEIFFQNCCFSECSALKQVDCSSAAQINYFEKSFNGKRREDFIICKPDTNFTVEINADDDTEDKSSMFSAFNRWFKP